MMKSHLRRSLIIAAASPVICAGLPSPSWAGEVSHAIGVVNGFNCDIWRWLDSSGRPRTVALKMEGAGNSGHGGYAVEMTYFAKRAGQASDRAWDKITVKTEASSLTDSDGDGGFGYFVSHERQRYFGRDKTGAEIWRTIASLFPDGPHATDSPLGRAFPALSSGPRLNSGATVGAQSFTIDYGHYGTTRAVTIDPESGKDSPPLTNDAKNSVNYAYYTIPVKTTWVFQEGMDYPRIDISVDFSKVIPPNSTSPTPNLVSFDVRGPYGVTVFDNGVDGPIDRVLWGDRQYVFLAGTSAHDSAWDYILVSGMATRSSVWDWSLPNKGARYHGLTAKGGTLGSFEIGLFEPLPAWKSALLDGYAAERGYTSKSYAEAVANPRNGLTPSVSSCQGNTPQTLPTDSTWPYQSLQYSLPCSGYNYLTRPAKTKKLAWGSSAYYGMVLPATFVGADSPPNAGWPPNNRLDYSVCLVLAWNSGPARNPRIQEVDSAAAQGAENLDTSLARAAAAYGELEPKSSNCTTEGAP